MKREVRNFKQARNPKSEEFLVSNFKLQISRERSEQ